MRSKSWWAPLEIDVNRAQMRANRRVPMLSELAVMVDSIVLFIVEIRSTSSELTDDIVVRPNIVRSKLIAWETQRDEMVSFPRSVELNLVVSVTIRPELSPA